MSDVDKLFAEVSKTALGRALLGYLKKNGTEVDVGFSDLFPDRAEDGGIYNPYENIICISPRLPLAEQVHVLAHETRHVAQMESDQLRCGPAFSFNIAASPYHTRMVMRVREVDADLFAIYFLHDHAAQTGSEYFAFMAGQGGEEEPDIGRREFYQRFDDILDLCGNDDRETIQAAMLGVAQLMCEDPDFLSAYDRMYLHKWAETLAPQMAEASMSEGCDDHGAFLKGMRVPGNTQAIATGCAKRYARLFTGFGVPNYLTPDTAPAYAENLNARPHWAKAQLARAVNAFHYYCGQIAEAQPAPSAKSPAGPAR